VVMSWVDRFQSLGVTRSGLGQRAALHTRKATDLACRMFALPLRP
jgi:hypothetical protein